MKLQANRQAGLNWPRNVSASLFFKLKPRSENEIEKERKLIRSVEKRWRMLEENYHTLLDT